MARPVKNVNRKIKVGWTQKDGEYWVLIRCDRLTHRRLNIIGQVYSRMGPFIITEGNTWDEWPVSNMRAILMPPEKLERLWDIARTCNGTIPLPEILKELAGY